VRIAVDPLIAALFPIPKIALMPLLLLAFGFGDASKIALVAIAVFFPVVVRGELSAACCYRPLPAHRDGRDGCRPITASYTLFF
jgi:hypothetical protein